MFKLPVTDIKTNVLFFLMMIRCGLPRLALMLSSVSRYTVVSTDLPSVVNNINRILSVPRRNIVDCTDDIFFESAMRRLHERNEEHNIVIVGAMDNTDDNACTADHQLNPLFSDRFRCSEMQIKFPVSVVWSLSDAQLPLGFRNKNHVTYNGRDEVKNLCSRLSTECSLILLDYLHCHPGNCDAMIASFTDLLRKLVMLGKKPGNVFTSQTLAVFPNRLCDAARHTDLKKYFSVRYVSQDSVDWVQIGKQYEDEMARLPHVSSVVGSNAAVLRAIKAVGGEEFVVLQRRLDGLVESSCASSDDDVAMSRNGEDEYDEDL